MGQAAAGAGASATLALSQKEVRGVMAGLMLAILLGALDQTIVSVALPRMSADLSGLDQLAWIVSGYLVAVAVSTPIYGKLGDLYGRRVVLSAAIVIFILTSVACAVAASMEMLVVARVLQGLGGGGLISVATTTVADVIAPRERGRYQGYISGAYALANVSGPIIGGLLTEHLSWRWIFWINLPLGLVALYICRRVLARLPVPSGKRGRVDVMGALLLAIGLGAILVALARIGQGAARDPAQILPLAALGVVMLAAYVWLERRTAEPLVPLRIFRYPAVAICCALLFIIFFELVSLTVLIPLRIQMAAGARVDLAALHLLPLTLAMPVGSLAGGWWMARTGRYKPVQLLGAALVPPGLAMLALFGAEAPFASHVCLGMAGLGLGIQIPAVMTVVQSAVPREHLGVATAATSFFRAFGAAAGTAVLTALLMAALRDALPAGPAEGEFLVQALRSAAAGLDAVKRASFEAMVYGAYREIFFAGALVAVASLALGMRLPNGTLGDRS